jgi:hypothetical protein
VPLTVASVKHPFTHAVRRSVSKALRDFASEVAILATTGRMPPFSVSHSIRSAEREFRVQREWVQRQGGRVVTGKSYKQFRGSDTLFILGSGSSIASITERQWKLVAEGDSIGFNWFMAHEFVPNFYHMELSNELVPVVRRFLESEARHLSHLPFSINIKDVSLQQPLSDYVLGREPFVAVPRLLFPQEKHAGSILRWYHDLADSPWNDFYLHYRGTLTLMIGIGVLMGYRKIVLVGVDLYDQDYFFYDERRFPGPIATWLRSQYQQSNEMQSRRAGGGKPHRTADGSLFRNQLTIQRFLEIYREAALTPMGVELMIANPKSLLAPLLPVAPGFERAS